MFCEQCAQDRTRVEVDDRGNVIGPLNGFIPMDTGICEACGREELLFAEWTEEDDEQEFIANEWEDLRWAAAHQDLL